MPPILSIISINLNNVLGLQKTIESIKNQTFLDYEYIIIDGGSSDGSVDFIEKDADKITYWVSEPDKGIYNAMNKGILKAKGDYCLFLNSGDRLINNNILEKVSCYLNQDDIIYGNGILETEGGKYVLKEEPNILTLDYFFTNTLHHPSAFIKKSLFDIYGLYNESKVIVSDFEFFIKTIIVNNVKTRKIPLEIAIFDTNGISSRSSNQEMIKQEREECLTRYFPPSVISAINDYKELKLLNLKKEIPSKRIEMLLYIERYKIMRSFFTVFLKTCTLLLPKKKANIK